MGDVAIHNRRGGTKLFAAIGVTYPAGSTVTCTNGSKTLKAKTTSGQWVFAIPVAGTWTVTATDPTGAEDPVSETVEITVEGQSVSVELSYRFWLYKNGNEYTDITGGWVGIKEGNSAVFELRETEMYIKGPNSNGIWVRTANPIDMTEFSTLEVILNNSGATNGQLGLTQSTAYGGNLPGKVSLGGNAGTPITYDVSSYSGLWYPCMVSLNGVEIVVASVELR